jgi:hypothetical protein
MDPKLARTLWIYDIVVLGLAAFAISMSFLLTPSVAAVHLFGWEVPTICALRRLTGLGCPGCGMIRSFTFLSHGAIGSALSMNLLGPFLYVVVFAQVPYRALRLLRGRSPREPG